VLVIVVLVACGSKPPPPPPPPPEAPLEHHAAPPAPEPPARTDYPVGDSPMSLVVAQGVLVWTDAAGAIWSMPADGGTPKQLSEQHSMGYMFHPVVVGGEIFVSGKRDVARVRFPSGDVAKMNLGLVEDPEEVVGDDHAIYVTLFKRDDVMAIPVHGGAPQKLASFKRGVLAQHGDTVYAVSYATGVLVAIPKSGGATRTIAKGFVRATALAADDNNVYVYTEKDGTLRKVELASGATSVLATQLGNADDLVSEGEWLYTVSWPSKLVRIAKDGSRTDVLADDLKSPTHIALDPTFVYVVSRDQNKIVRLRKSR